jgi:hypothetical protein
MNRAEFADLADDIARELGRLRGEEWTAQQDERYETGAVLAGGIARLRISGNYRTGRLNVAGLGPDGIGRTGLQRTWDISVNPDRGAPAVAKDVNRRILGAGYADDLLVARARKAEHDELEAKRAAWLDQVRELFALKPATVGPGMDPGKVYLGKFVKGSGYVQNYGWSAEHADMLDINLSGIPAQVMLDMLAVLAKHVARECRCCSTFGPGHHPDLAVTGCLHPCGRSPAERGELGSREAVLRYLVTSHGVTPYKAALALDEARASRYEMSEIYHGERLVAIVSWDTAGLGEYTVEVPREAS